MPPQIDENPVLACGHCREYERVDRRAFLTRGLPSAAALIGGRLAALPVWMPRLTLSPQHTGPRGDTLVTVFLRGGADGLNMIVPHGDDNYYAYRPTLAIPRPDDMHAEFRTIDLDGFFGLHPSLAALSDVYRAGDMAFVHATGSPDESRSHFEAMALMERGAITTGEYTGWLARHLATLDTGNDSPLRAVGLGEILPTSLTGTISAIALQSVESYHLNERPDAVGAIGATLASLYEQEETVLTAVARQTFAAIGILSRVQTEHYQPAGRAYPETDFGRGMSVIAQLIKADVGVETACIDLGGWDTHAGQGAGRGQMARLMEELATGLTAFHEDNGAGMGSITVLVMSEFGRRAQENAALGTDHGHGNMMMVMGGGINGGQVYGRWPGLADEQLTGPGDLALTTDYRDVLGEIIRRRLNNPLVAGIFPGYTVTEMGLAAARL